MFATFDTYEEFSQKQKVIDLENESEPVKLYHRKPTVKINAEGSNIIKYFSGKNVLVTGGTGFLGKVLIEKLLRSCEDIANIYVLVRPKKGKDVKSRLEETLKDPLFFSLHELRPKVNEKIIGIKGDISLPDLDLNNADRNFLTKNIDIIFHVAATTKFDEKLKLATAINVGGTLETMKLAQECVNLKVLAYVSTAYSNCPRKDIDEIFYDPSIKPESLLQFTRDSSDDVLDRISPGLLGKWPNTYTFTKALAEDVVKRYSYGIPTCVVRPSIVSSTYREPLLGWTDNFFGPAGLLAAGGSGLLRAFFLDKNVRFEVVPVDFVTNALIASVYKTSQLVPEKPTIYNYVTDRSNYMTFHKFLNILYADCSSMVPLKTIYDNVNFVTKNARIFAILTFIFHTLVASCIDTILPLFGSKFRLQKLYKKIDKFSVLVSYFCTQDWDHSNNNTQALWLSLNQSDQKAFPFDAKTINFRELVILITGGIRTFLLREPWSNLKEARRRMAMLKMVHKIVQTVWFLIIFGILYYVFSKI